MLDLVDGVSHGSLEQGRQMMLGEKKKKKKEKRKIEKQQEK